ncbi:MAG: DUF4115 domain-containing protein, partial [Acidobacteria bacterium]|nr:DUF4115 domain-containing protein [Acidobacteriota bacterium]
MDVGTQLREARQARGVTLEQVAASTKVSRQTLDHIDHNRFNRLPGGILTKGYLRAYAAQVGLNPEQIVRSYLVQCFGETGENLPLVPPRPMEVESHSGRSLAIGIMAVVIIALVASNRRSAEPPAMISSMDAEQLQGTSGSPSTRAAASPGAVAAPEDSAELEIEFRATGPCWVSATADGQLVVYRLLQDGDRELLTAREELVLRVGDPQTFEY